MKFTDTLKNQQNPEWRSRYISYEALKDTLYEGIQKAPNIRRGIDINSIVFGNYVAGFDDMFFLLCSKELEKVDEFVHEKYREAESKYNELKAQLEELQEHINSFGHVQKFWSMVRRKSLVTEGSLEEGFQDLYADLVKLNQFLNLNYLGLRKILKKHDSLFQTNHGYAFLLTKVNDLYLKHNKNVRDSLKEIESIVTTVFEGGSRARAMRVLRVPVKDTKMSACTGFKLGIMLGICVVLVIGLVFVGFSNPSRNGYRIVIRLYRGPLVITLYMFLIGLNLYIWRERGINYVYIFDLDQRRHLVHHNLWNIAALLGVVWALSLITFLNLRHLGVPVYLAPLGLMIFQITFLFNPFQTCYFHARIWLLQEILRILTAPIHRVSFADFWLADQLSSLVSFMLDYQYMICFFLRSGVFQVMDDRVVDERVCITTASSLCECEAKTNVYRPIILLLPSSIRIVQCFRRYYDNHLVFPHLVNALKYVLQILSSVATILNAYGPQLGFSSENTQIMFYLWIGFSIVSSLYSYSWDVTMDWGLLYLQSPRNRILRKDLMYSANWYYYAALVGNLFLRFSWAISLGLTEMQLVQTEIMLSITTPAEVFRRFVWNLFRVENEHINNHNADKLVTDLSDDVTPFGEEQEMQQLLNLMDGDDRNEKTRYRSKQLQLTSSIPKRIIPVKLTLGSKTELYTKTVSELDLESLSDASSNDLSTDGKGVLGKIADYYKRFSKRS